MTAAIEDLKTATELLERAEGLLREAAKVTFLPSEAMRQSVRDELPRIRLKLFMLRRAVTILGETAYRRKPPSAAKKRPKANDVG